MHDIEPHFQWRDKYKSEEDPRSPFYGREYDEFGFHNRVYNYLLHPQWDEFGSETLYLKILYTDYVEGYTIIQLIGEWNDALHNDVMHLKREIIDELLAAGIYRYVLIAEEVLNFHAGEDDYYQEWLEECRTGDGWIVMLNLLDHVATELNDARLDTYLHFSGYFLNVNWRTQKPSRFIQAIESLVRSADRYLE